MAGQLYYQLSSGVWVPISGTGGGGGGSGGASAFTDLTDVPASYAGSGSKVVSVKADASGLEFTTASSGGADILQVQIFS